MGDVVEIIERQDGSRIAVLCLWNPRPIEHVRIDAYSNGDIVLVDKEERARTPEHLVKANQFVLDKASVGRRINRGSLEAFDRGNTIIVEVEISD